MTEKSCHHRRYGSLYTLYLDQQAIEFLDSGLSPEEWFRCNICNIKSDEKKESGIVNISSSKAVFVKRFFIDNAWQKILYALYKDQALQTFKLSLDMASAGVPIPRPLAVIRDPERKKKSVYLLSEALRHYRTLKKTIIDLKDPAQVQDVLDYLAVLLAKMHNAGFFHGDMKWKNIMIDARSKNSACFIDLDTAGRLISRRDRRYARDLARFCIDIQESLPQQGQVCRFITAYSRFATRTPKSIMEHTLPYHMKIAAKHRAKYGIEPTPLKLDP